MVSIEIKSKPLFFSDYLRKPLQFEPKAWFHFDLGNIYIRHKAEMTKVPGVHKVLNRLRFPQIVLLEPTRVLNPATERMFELGDRFAAYYVLNQWLVCILDKKNDPKITFSTIELLARNDAVRLRYDHLIFCEYLYQVLNTKEFYK